jgi:hypothetical protein
MIVLILSLILTNVMKMWAGWTGNVLEMQEIHSLVSYSQGKMAFGRFGCRLLLWLYSPLLGLGHFFNFLILYTGRRTSWTGDQPGKRPLPTHRTTQTQNKRRQYRHPCPEWDSNSRSQRSSGRRQFMP